MLCKLCSCTAAPRPSRAPSLASGFHRAEAPCAAHVVASGSWTTSAPSSSTKQPVEEPEVLCTASWLSEPRVTSRTDGEIMADGEQGRRDAKLRSRKAVSPTTNGVPPSTPARVAWPSELCGNTSPKDSAASLLTDRLVISTLLSAAMKLEVSRTTPGRRQRASTR